MAREKSSSIEYTAFAQINTYFYIIYVYVLLYWTSILEEGIYAHIF